MTNSAFREVAILPDTFSENSRHEKMAFKLLHNSLFSGFLVLGRTLYLSASMTADQVRALLRSPANVVLALVDVNTSVISFVRIKSLTTFKSIRTFAAPERSFQVLALPVQQCAVVGHRTAFVNVMAVSNFSFFVSDFALAFRPTYGIHTDLLI